MKQLALALVASLPVLAQLMSPNEAGVTMGHVHLFVKDVAAQKHFWTTVVGGTAVKNEKLEMIQIPGVYIVFRQADSTTGPPEGSIVNHIGLVWKDLPSELAKWKAMGVKIDQTGNPNQGYINAPDGIRVEFFGDPTLSHPVEMNHIHFFPQDVEGIQAWYGKTFGGVVGKRARVSRPGWTDSVDLPGVNLSFSHNDKPMVPTAGRSLDHIGFEIKNLPGFVKKLEAQGIKFDEALRSSPNSSKLHVTYLTDPWGTRIELTEGLAP